MILSLGLTPTIARTMRFAALTLDGVNRTADVREYAAGKAVNAARAMKRLGGRPRCLGVVGGDRGRHLRRMLDGLFVDHDFIDVDAATRLCVTVIDDATRTATELVEESSRLSGHDAPAVIESLRRAIAGEPVKGLLLSGSLAPGVRDDFYARCVDVAMDEGIMCVVDASGAALRAALDVGPTVVKLNAAEFCQTFALNPADESQLISQIREAASACGAWFVVTRGPLATICSDGASTWRVTTPSVEAVSAIGGGDVLAGVLTMRLAEGAPIDDAVIEAAACATASVLTPHAAEFDPATARKLQEHITMHEVSG
jgi:1-phosphofructokinase family hexose kinase